MPNNIDMSKPVTHGELREILAEAFSEHTKSMLAFIAAAFAENMKQVAHLIKGSEESIRAHINALLEKSSADDAATDNKYSDLPRRVTRLERAVFPAKRKRRR